MEFQKVIESRRSVRNYDRTKKIDKDIINELIEAAIQAPSWKNAQASRYYCIRSEELVERFRAECLPDFNAKNAEGAAALIVTAFVQNRSGFERSGEPSNEAGNGWGFYDLGLQSENLILKAKDIGLDTLVMGIRDENRIRTLLGIADDQIIVSVIAVGYATKESVKPKRKTPEEIVRFY